MNEEKRYIDILLSEEKYIKELDVMYEEITGIRRFKRRMDEIEKEVTWYIGNEKTNFIPSYDKFYVYAYENYLMREEESFVHSSYKALLGDYVPNKIPGYVYCLVLLARLEKEEMAFLQKHQEDYESLSPKVISEYRELHCKVKLLNGFLEKINRLVAIFVNSIDMKEIEHLDDNIKELDPIAIKHRFMHALRKRDKTMSFKLLGRMRELDEGEDYYFEALAHYINEEYREAIRYIDKIEKDNIDYNSAKGLELECYALLGDAQGFVDCIENDKTLTFNFWHIDYLLMTLILHLNLDEENDIEWEENTILDEMKFDENDDPFYRGQLFRMVADIVIEGLNILEERELIMEIAEDASFSENKIRRWEQLSLALSVFPADVSRLLDRDYIKDKDIGELKKEAENALLELLINYTHEKPFENLKKALLCQLFLGNTQGFLDNISNGFDTLIAFSENGEVGADELLRIAYIEGTVRGNVDAKLRERVEQYGTTELQKDICDKKILHFLSEQGRVAYSTAEWQFMKSEEEDYGWKDAGMISLSFYRILEVELNQKIIIPLLSSIGYANLETTYENYVNTLTGNDKSQYRKRWGKILSTYQNLESQGFAEGGFMLGVMDCFFRAIGSNYDPTDALGTLIKSNLGNVLNAYGIEKFEEGFFEIITGENNRNKYRNPPAHTKYLSYETACECRRFFKEVIIQWSDMLK